MKILVTGLNGFIGKHLFDLARQATQSQRFCDHTPTIRIIMARWGD